MPVVLAADRAISDLEELDVQPGVQHDSHYERVLVDTREGFQLLNNKGCGGLLALHYCSENE